MVYACSVFIVIMQGQGGKRRGKKKNPNLIPSRHVGRNIFKFLCPVPAQRHGNSRLLKINECSSGYIAHGYCCVWQSLPYSEQKTSFCNICRRGQESLPEPRWSPGIPASTWWTELDSSCLKLGWLSKPLSYRACIEDAACTFISCSHLSLCFAVQG